MSEMSGHLMFRCNISCVSTLSLTMDFRVQQTPSFGLTSFPKNNDVLTTTHIEYASLPPPSIQNDRNRPRDQKHHKQASDGLPFIPAGEVENAAGTDGSAMWIVIDDIVYDVTNFAKRHPGGQAPLRNLSGKSCSWQFHKIHSKNTLESLGAELRVGRTSNVPNPYKEPKPTLIRQLWKPSSF